MDATSSGLEHNQPPMSLELQVPLEEFVSDDIDYSGHFACNEHFVSDSDAISWARKIALQIGFKLIVSSHKNNGRSKLLRCNRGERYRGVFRDLDSVSQKHRKAKSCKCPFQIRVEKLYGSDSWAIVPKPGEKGRHNHGLVVYPKTHREITGLSVASKQIVGDITRAQAKPCALAVAQEKFLKDTPARGHIYNYRDKLRRDAFEGRDIMSQFYHLAITNNYVHWTQVNPKTNVVTHLFMAHPSAVNLLWTYKWYIGMDCMFKTNKYKMSLLEIVGKTPCNKNFLIAYAMLFDETEASFMWVLQRLKVLIGIDVSPTVIVTHRELGLMNPIADVFPNTVHMFCTWHINKDVENKVYRLTGKNKQQTERFKNGKWKKILEAATDDEYTSALIRMRNTWGHRPDVLQYVERRWLVYKEMFVCRWTNDALHFGNVRNCGVESARAELKHWLSSSTGALRTLWTKVENEIHAQLTTIRYRLEDSRNHRYMTYSGFPFNYLAGHVSHYCLELLDRELQRMRGLGVHVYDRCGCVLPRTHGLPCACELKRAVDSWTPINLHRIHEFWRTLVIRDGLDVSECIDRSFENYEYFNFLVNEVLKAGPAVVRRISLLIHEKIHPEQIAYIEPQVMATGKTRPRESSPTRRFPSAWEYSQRERCRPPSSSPSRSCRYTSSSSVNMDSTLDGSCGRNIQDFPYIHLIVVDILPYVEGYVDVCGDGNCGFRVFADYYFGGEEQWRLARQCIANEIIVKRDIYNAVYYGDIDAAYYRISWEGGPCQSDHWMAVVEDLFPIATLFNAVVMYFGYGQGTRNGFNCMTVLPLQAPSTATQPEREIIFGHLGDNYKHYIRLNLTRDFPIPPIVHMWYTQHQPSVNNWDRLYATRRAQWDRNVAQ